MCSRRVGPSVHLDILTARQLRLDSGMLDDRHATVQDAQPPDRICLGLFNQVVITSCTAYPTCTSTGFFCSNAIVGAATSPSSTISPAGHFCVQVYSTATSQRLRFIQRAAVRQQRWDAPSFMVHANRRVPAYSTNGDRFGSLIRPLQYACATRRKLLLLYSVASVVRPRPSTDRPIDRRASAKFLRGRSVSTTIAGDGDQHSSETAI